MNVYEVIWGDVEWIVNVSNFQRRMKNFSGKGDEYAGNEYLKCGIRGLCGDSTSRSVDSGMYEARR